MNENKRNNRLGDEHNGVYVSKVIYDGYSCIKKPRSAKIERAFNAFLLEMEKKGFFYLPGKVDIIEDFGLEHYVKIVKNEHVQTKEEVHLYYKRCGTLLCLAYLFSSTDLHRENLVANGSFPTIVDYETLLSGEENRWDKKRYSLLFSDSVWSSFLLPRWVRNGERIEDLSGLTGRNMKLFDHDIYGWRTNQNILFLKETPTFAWDYIEDITQGFRETYNFLMSNGRFVSGWLDLFSDCSFRVIFRKTEIYYKIAELIEDYSIEKRRIGAQYLLERAYLKDIDHSRIQKVHKILEEEVRAVVNNEIPLFNVKADELSIRCHDEVLCTRYFQYSPLEKANRKLKNLSVINRDGQIKIIKEALLSTMPINLKQHCNNIRNINICYTINNKAKHYNKPVPSESITIFNTLEEKYINGMPDGWIYLKQGLNNSVALSGIGMGLYHGVMGILCFYGALYAMTGDDSYLTRIRELYEPIRSHIFSMEIWLDDNVASLSAGLGGILSVLFHLNELTGDSFYSSEAEYIIEKIGIPDHLKSGISDYLNGYAGFGQVLRKTQNRKKAVTLAEALRPILLEREPLSTGFAHGVAGYVYSLGILDSILEDDYSASTICKLIKWEDQHYDKKNKNWIDTRQPNKFSFMNGWCNGTPGILMAREELRKIAINEQVHSFCSDSIALVKKSFPQPFKPDHDCLCCGHAAQIMIASRIGINADTVYQELLNSVRLDVLNFQHLIHTGNFIPGLMQGYSGIGYAITMYGDKRSGGMLV